MTTSALTNFQEKRLELQQRLQSKGVIKRMSEVIPAHAAAAGMTAERVRAIVLDATLRSPQILDCDLATVVQSAISATELGLEVGGVLGEAYLVPHKRKASLILGYKGIVKLAIQGGNIVKVESACVMRQDEFSYQRGTDPRIHHVPNDESGRLNIEDVTHAYAVAFFVNGGHTQFEVMNVDELLRIRDRSPSASASVSPWKTDPLAMCRKTAIRKLMNYVPLSPLAQRALELDGDNHHHRQILSSVAQASALPESAGGDDEILDAVVEDEDGK